MADVPVDDEIRALTRGAVDVISRDELSAKIARARETKRPLRVKLGIDPTASDIHLGFAVVLRRLRRFQDFGHKAVLIVGDYTAQVGDPSGKNRTRPMLGEEEVRANAKSYIEQMGRIIDVERLEVRWNGDWFRPMPFLEVIRLASQITVARMLERDDFQKRMQAQAPISMHELLYPLMQGYDSVAVESDVELGGTDQLFNLLVGRDLQRERGLEPQVCLTTPLLEGLDGVNKMSKSLGNYIGIAEEPKEQFFKLMRVPDALMGRYFLLCTDVAEAEIERLVAGDANPRDAKLRLASEVVRTYHGEAAAGEARERWLAEVSKGELPEAIAEFAVPADLLKDGKVWLPKLIVAAGLAASNREARALVESGGAHLDGEKVVDAKGDVAVRDGQVLRAGKGKYVRLRIG